MFLADAMVIARHSLEDKCMVDRRPEDMLDLKRAGDGV
jgi:hypothetical protein